MRKDVFISTLVIHSVPINNYVSVKYRRATYISYCLVNYEDDDNMKV